MCDRLDEQVDRVLFLLGALEYLNTGFMASSLFNFFFGLSFIPTWSVYSSYFFFFKIKTLCTDLLVKSGFFVVTYFLLSNCALSNDSSIFLSICQYIHLSILPFIHSSVHPTIHSLIYPTIISSVHIFCHLCIFLNFFSASAG